ncbi:hypothetical protein Y032_0001g262 [Ancylostoma ceylanicum]|uniref:Endonuclease/exonuclease/phosphatase domain-containing protein n=1 Tax=Ancylostoma ceylanicum TaxID=53326 RepID=A0A016W2R3_9BILA|nr:hypothetical protein Y032_0001g262 [Ancylostoma ceylanicum]
MFKAISDLISCDRQCIVVGDFNIPGVDWSCNNVMSNNRDSILGSLLEMCSMHGLLQHVHLNTHGNNVLDLVFTNKETLVRGVTVGPPVGTSDHATVAFGVELPMINPTYLFLRSYKDADFDAIRMYLSDIDWYGSLDSVQTVDDKYELFLAILSYTIDLFVPLKKVPACRAHLPQYLNSLFQKRLEAWDSAVANGSDDNWETYRRVNETFERKLWKFNNSVEKKVINSRDKSAFYKMLKKRLNVKPQIGILTTNEGRLISTDNAKAEVLADVFTQSFSVETENSCTHSSVMFPSMNDSVWFHGDEIYDLLVKWPARFTLTPDCIPLHFIKN